MSNPLHQTHDIGAVFRLAFWQSNFNFDEYHIRFQIQQKKQQEMSKNSGNIIETAYGELGRTYNSKGLVNGKVPVYLQEGEN